MEILDMRDRISSINVELLVDESILHTKDALLELVRSQILHGETKVEGWHSGSYSKWSYKSGYIDDKHDLGLFPVNTEPYYNLNWTGRFLSSIKAVIYKEFIEISGSDETESYVKINVSPANLDLAYELSEERLNEYARYHFLPAFTQNLKYILDL